MEQPPPNSAGNTPSPSANPRPPRSRRYLAGGQTSSHASLEREVPPPPPPPVRFEERRRVPGSSSNRTERGGPPSRTNRHLAAQHASAPYNRVHRRVESQRQLQQPRQRPLLRPNPPNRATFVAGPSQPLRPADSRQVAESRPMTSIPTIGRILQPNLAPINRGHGRLAFTVQLFSPAAGRMLDFRAVIDDGIEHSVVYPSVLRALGLNCWDFPCGHPLLGQHRWSPMARYVIRRFTGLAINQLSLGIEAQEIFSMVFEDDFLHSDVDIYFGTQFINSFLGGQLPRLLSPHHPTSATISRQDFFEQGR